VTGQAEQKNSSATVSAALATLGCKVNQCESAGIAEELALRGVTVVPFEDEADVYIINTCTVTQRTDYQSRQLISRAARRNPEAVIIVTGCYAQRAPGEIASLSGVRLVVGNAEKKLIPELVRDASVKKQQILVAPVRDEKTISPLGGSVFPEHTRAFLKIQDGCDAFCSYCVIPYTRGKSRSLPLAQTLERMAALTVNGYREIVLTGIHLGLWGRDLTPASDLASLLRMVEEKRLAERLRISSIEPLEINNDIISLIKKSHSACPHLHISLQSGSNRILGLMRRNYSAEFFRDLTWKIAGTIKDVAIGIDVITGFPGETDVDFAETLDFISALPVAYLHVFPFSSRPGTPAAGMQEQVPEAKKKERARLLREAGAEKRRRFAGRFIGKSLKVLIEGRIDKISGLPMGFSENYIQTAVRGEGLTANSIVAVTPVALDGERLIAECDAAPPEGRCNG
jgi:threonylcarbamoyladenosine tRNA methylthiotransferase MtaB